VKEVERRQHAEKVAVSSHALATQTRGDLQREKMASRLVIQSLQNNADKKIHRLEDKLKDSKTMVKKVSLEYERKLKNAEEDSKKMFKKVSREYEGNLRNVEDDSKKVTEDCSDNG
jgi:hypothetical protein